MTAVAERQPSPSNRRIATVIEFAEISKFCEDLRNDLEHLVREGMLEAFRDERNVLRFRPKAMQ